MAIEKLFPANKEIAVATMVTKLLSLPWLRNYCRYHGYKITVTTMVTKLLSLPWLQNYCHYHGYKITVTTMVTKELPGTPTVHKKRKEMISPVATIMHPSMYG